MADSGTNTTHVELAVIGCGMAGMAAAFFAAGQGINTCQIGVSGGLLYATGFLDLMGIHPIETATVCPDPVAAINSLCADQPDHPYARMNPSDITGALHDFMNFLGQAGLPYRFRKGHNTKVFSSAGTVKPTYGIPESMWEGAVALEKKPPCLMVDFWGLKGYSAVQVVETLSSGWPDLKYVRIPFPVAGLSSDLYPEQAAWALELDENIEKLAEEIRPNLNSEAVVGLPAVCGMMRTGAIMARLEEYLGVPVFEVPTIPPSIPGLRMKDHLESALADTGIRRYSQKRVLSARPDTDHCFVLGIGDMPGKPATHTVRADSVILASGRFLGMGLFAGRKVISEPLFNLPVTQPETREKWHCENFFDRAGHPLNRAGIEVNESFMPIDASGRPVHRNLFACGSILAHQDWVRQKCGSGLAVATAFAAAKSAAKFIREN